MSESIPWSLLANSWAKQLSGHDPNKLPVVAASIRKTLPLLQDPTAVPFVCRYRQEMIAPLSNANVQQLAEDLKTYQSLESLRNRILQALPSPPSDALRERIQTSISKVELDDLYAPYKPAAKGSLEERIQQSNPKLVEAVDRFWEHGQGKLRHGDENTIILLANRIASHLGVMDALHEYSTARCGIKVSESTPKKGEATKKRSENSSKFRTYHDFECTVSRLQDHQVLAIRRGVDQKALAMQFTLDNDRAESIAHRVLRDRITTSHGKLWKDAIHNAFTRLMRKRCTSRVWKTACSKAEERAIRVFCNNLRSALLAPPLKPAAAVLCLDPGFKAGIKVAMIDAGGELVDSSQSTCTVQFVSSWEKGREQLTNVLRTFDQAVAEPWVVALGNGHGSQEARKLAVEALESAGKPHIPIKLVDEAGASVWSVTQAAAEKYPSYASSALAAISIARRLQNPLDELVKIPPRSLGLGMYQHDFSEKALEERLEATSIDAVAEIGVDGNACSREILEKVPGLTSRLAERIIKARPLRTREDILKVLGIGPSTFENCAAFIRVQGGEELDSTQCHPESYDLSRYLLRKCKWRLGDPSSVSDVPRKKEEKLLQWKTLVERASKKFDVSEVRVLSVLDQLVRSISNQDPRLVDANIHQDAANQESSDVADTCTALPSHLSSLKSLEQACPVRSVTGTVRNVVDFGVFVDFGGESDGLLHRSKLGSIGLGSLLVGQTIGIDILQVDGNRVSLAVAGQSQETSRKRRGHQKTSSHTTTKRRRR